MSNLTDGGAERLDSWKAIADYLDRDVATVRRWEKSLNLPVRRVGGVSGGRSVFAFRREIDDWLLAQTLPKVRPPDPEPRAEETVASAPPAPVAPPRYWRWTAALVTLVTGLAGVAWYGRGSSAGAGPMTVEVTASGVVARGADGTQRWTHAFPADHRFYLVPWQHAKHALDTGAGSVVVGTSWSEHIDSRRATSGQLLQLSLAGHVDKTFSFDDRIAFTSATYAAPWTVTDFRRSGASIAVAAHHLHWWPSVVTVLDRDWKRTATFVHSGWIEHLHWLSPDRLVAAGFSNARNGGMVALLDPATMNGQSPRADDPQYTCATCGPEAPLRYVVFPRSELNRVTNSPFNAAQLEPAGERLVLRTIEVPKEASPADALYEFSPALELLHASYGDRYWEIHRSLEVEGKIRHSREQCPDRHGPRAIEIWEPTTGWRTVRVR